MFGEIIRKITKNKYYLIGAISILLLLVITLGTAFLRSTLSIVGTTKIKENSWIIYFDHVHDEQFTDNVTPEKRAIIVDNEKTRIEFTVDLKPGEVYEYTVDMINDGSINASIETLEKTVLSNEQKKYLDFEVYYTEGLSAGLEPKVCDRLDAGTKREIKVSVRYKKGLNLEDYPTDDVHLNLFFDITYIKEVLTCPDEPSAHKLTVDPNGGTFENYEGADRKDKIVKYLSANSNIYPASYEIPTPVSDEYNFDGWEVIVPGEDEPKTFILSNEPNENGNYVFTIGNEDVELKAKWKPGNYVARIQRKKFETIQAAFDAASDSQYASDNTVHLLRSTEEYPINNTRTPFVFDLEAFTVTGRITNSANGNLTLVNGVVQEKEDDPNDNIDGAVINYGTLSLGQDDGLVDVENSIALKGDEVGLNTTNGIFNFYDGFIEGDIAYSGKYKGHPNNYYVFINDITVGERKIRRAYLVNNYTRAVVKTQDEDGSNEVVYYNLQTAINTVIFNKEQDPTLTDYELTLRAIRDFEAAYDITVPEDEEIYFDLENYRVWTGANVTNNGTFHVYSSNNTRTTIRNSKPIVNNGTMNINNINVTTSTDSNVIINNGALDISNTEVHGQHTYAVTNNGTATMTFDNKSFIDSIEHYGLYNSSPNLNITNGTIYGFYNDANGVEISGGNFKIYHWTTESWYIQHHYIAAVTNTGTINITGGIIDNNEYDTCMINNTGRLNISGGDLNSVNKTICNNYNSSYGHTYVTGGNLTGDNTVVAGGYLNISNNASVTSVSGPVIDSGDLEINRGTASTTTGKVANYSNVTLTNGEIVTGNGTAIDGNNYDTVTISGGTIHSLSGTAINGTHVNVSGGLIEGTTYGIQNGLNVTVTGGEITSDDKAITCSSINVSGGEITSPNDAIITTNITVTDGTIHSTNGTAITLNGTGTVLNGDIHGGMYGVLNNGKLIIGSDEDGISPDIPVIIGDSVGVYITGTDTYFFDGILKGQVDGYIGEITRTPLGGTPASGTETIGEDLYQTDYIIQFEPWLEIEGVGQFNTIDAASSAINDGETATIKVIKDVVPSFVQHFIDENHNKNITFDLNGHTLRSTQVAYNNESNVRVIDSVGTGKITNDISHYFENDYNMTVDGITMISTGNKAAIRNFRHGTLTIEDATITAHNNGLQNMGSLIINDITLTADLDGIWAECIDELYDHAFGTVTLNDGTITTGQDGLYGRGTFIMNGGSIEVPGIGVKTSGTTVNGGRIHSTGDVAIYAGTTVNDGTVISDASYAIYTDGTISVKGGYVEGTTALSHYAWYDLYSHAQYDKIYVSGGKVVGTTGYGIKLVGNETVVTGGEVYGEIDGIYGDALITLGNNEGTISKTTPLVQGKRYGIKSNSKFYFYDGIIKGATAARDGQVNLVPDAAMVIDDYEFINRVEYKTEYLEAYGNWLRVGDQEFNSLYAAQAVIEDYGTVYVTKDVNINFEQSLVAGKHVTFDLDGHQVMMVKTLTTKGTNTITDSSTAQTGLLRNISEIEDLSAVTNEGNLTIVNGHYDSLRTYAITNKGTMIINDIDLEANGCIANNSYLEINGGKIRNTSTDRYPIHNNWNGPVLVVNDGEISSDYTVAIYNENSLTVNGGTIKSTVTNSIRSSCYYSGTTINGGEITGFTNGIVAESTDRNNLSITGGKIVGQTGSAVTSTGWRTYVTGGTLEGKIYGLSLNDGGTIGSDDGIVVIDTPVIKGDSYGLNVSGGTLNFNDGILKGVNNSIQGLITNIPAGTQEYNDTETIESVEYQTKYLIQEKDLVYNVQKDKRYNNLQLAFDEAEEGNTLELLTNIPIYYPVTNNNSNSFTLDLKGYSISTNKSITNNGRLTIEDSEETGTIKTSSSINLIVNTNTLTLNKFNLVNNSSSNYIVSNSGTLTINETKINGINCVNSSGTLSVNNAEIFGSNAGISSSGRLTINDGTYGSDQTAIYSSGTGTNEILEATVNGRIQNTRGTLDIKKTAVNFNSKNDYRYADETIENSGTIRLIQETTIIGKGRISNSGNMTIDGITIDINSAGDRSHPVSMIYNSGTMTIDNTNITLEKNVNRDVTRGITNTGTLRLEDNVNIEIGTHDKEVYGTHYGILTSDYGNTIIDGTSIKIHGMNTTYGLYVDGANAKTTLLAGSVSVTDTKYAYGAYTSRGTLEFGVSDDIEQEEPGLVSIINPLVTALGDIRGVGVKKVNGNFNFYDGKIIATTYAKPETTTRVQNLYEVTTYVDESTTYEYAVLEYMGNNYDNTVVAMIGQHSFFSLQSAIDDPNENNEEIVLVRSVEVDTPIEIPAGKNVVLDLHGMSLTTSMNIYGSLQVYNGTIIETGVDDPETEEIEEHNYINNSGTLIIGKDDGTVSSSNIRIISEGIAINNIHNDGYNDIIGRIEMYDGYIEGNPAIDGSIDKIADFARLYTKKDKQYERIYLQSLSREAIESGETDLIVSIDPNGGIVRELVDPIEEIYEDHNEKFIIYLNYVYNNTYDLVPNPTKHACIFNGWEANDDSVLSEVVNGYRITIGLKDIDLKAKWIVDPNAVAKIGDNYYFSIEEAHEAAKNGDTIVLLKDVTLEDEMSLVINKDITLDLGGHVISGNVTDNAVLINNGILTIINGQVKNDFNNETGIGVINNKTLTLGVNDGEIKHDNVYIFGKAVGLQQEGALNFYDGIIEGLVSMNGSVSAAPKGYFLYTEPNELNDPPTQKLFLSGNPENAVAIIEDGTNTQYFFKLTSAIAAAHVNGKEIKIIKDFEATYPITVNEGMNIVINMFGYDITTGQTITNNGSLKIYDTDTEDTGSITSAKSLINNGTLTIEDITINQSRDVDTIITSGVLNVNNATINNTNGNKHYTINNTGTLNILGDSTITTSVGRAIYTNGIVSPISSGTISGIETFNDLTINDGANIVTTNNYEGLYVRGPITLTVNGGTIKNTGGYRGIYLDANNANIIINGGYIEGYSAIQVQSGSGNTITINDLEYTATPPEGEQEKVSVNGINNCGIRINSDNNTVNVNKGYVKGAEYGICVYAYNTHINVAGDKVYGVSYDGIIDDSQQGDSGNTKKIDITGGLIVGGRYGIRKYNSDLYISNAEVKTLSTDKDTYAIYTRWGDITLKEGAFVNAPTASGIYAEDGVHIKEGSKIYSGNAGGYGIYGYWLNGDMSGGEIETVGRFAKGIYFNTHYSNDLAFTMTGGTIKSGNIGVSMTESSQSNHRFNLYGGIINGGNYGIYITHSGYVLNIGNNEDELSTTEPLVVGTLYGVYNTGGKVNFYGGRLRGAVFGYKNDLNQIRTLKDIVTENYYEELDGAENILTIPAQSPTTEPVADTAKKGNGYAKITYLGETVEGICTHNEVYPFDYTGSIVSWYAPCSGQYKLEVWGAAGSYYAEQYASGFGGYSTGEISLSANEELFVVVGGNGPFYGSNNYGPGGYNGGGGILARWGDGNERRGTGGGATHIATKTGLLKTLSNDRDKVIIVAGGGGGAATNAVLMNSGRGIAGNGGGYIGGTGYGNNYSDDNTFGYGGTQTTGYAFGQGQESEQGNLSGAGGGWYGGYQTNRGSGGGSGYIGNSRLTNKHMAGYDVPYMNSDWIDNYLVNKANFLEVDGELFNSIDAASAAIAENGSGTIKLIKDASLNDDSTFLANRTITFDLNGYKLANAVNLYNDADLTMIDSSDNKTGEIGGVYNDTIQNRNKITLDGISIVNSANAKACVYSSKVDGTVTFKDTTCSAPQGHGIWAGVKSSVSYENSTITSYYYGIGLNAASSTLNVTSGTINVTGSSAYGIYTNGDSNRVTIDNVNITSARDAIYLWGNGAAMTINDGNIKGTRHAIYVDTSHNTGNRPNFYVNGGYFEAGDHTIDIQYANIYLKDAEVKTTSTSNGTYGVVIRSWAYAEIKDGTFINAPNASGLYSNGGYKITGGRVLAGHAEGRGLYADYIDLTMTGGSIETSGASSHGIYHYSDHAAINISGGTITSNNNGITLLSGNSDRNVNITGGEINAKNYGIQQSNSYTTNIGSLDATLSQTIPHITGDRFAVYNTSGTVNFYNGRLTTKEVINKNDIGSIRAGKEIIYEYEYLDNTPLSITVNTTSSEAETNTPKEGNGHARLTYLGETSGDCINGTVYNFIYTGAEQEFNTICGGEYFVEVWGAQGGGGVTNSNDGSRAGAGGYASGYINFDNTETLYINVGGQGGYGEGTSSYGGPLGGYNGGGNGGNSISGAGGGATHIALDSGLLTTFENKQDKLIIVAGGGGGSDNIGDVFGGSDDGSGGSGGGHIGGNAYVAGSPRANTGGNQSNIGPFGRGENVSTSTDTGGGGGGYHGGKVTNNNNGGGGGGSGYTDNPRLSNAKMYGYMIPTSGYLLHAYLDTPSGFLEVDGVEYNSFESAIAAISTSGTIKLLRDIYIRDQATFPTDKTITFDLNGKNLQITKPIINNGVLTITDNVGGATLSNKFDDVFVNNNDLTLNKGTFTGGYSIVYSNHSSGNLTVNKDATLSATNGITINGTHNITINNAKINASQYGVELVGSNNVLNMTGGTITATTQGIRNTSSGANIHLDGTTITAANEGIYTNGNATIVRVENSTLTATTYNGITQGGRLSDYATINVSNSTITGAQYGIYSYYDNLTITNSTIKTTANDRGRYAILSDGWDTITLNGNTKVMGQNSSGIRAAGNLIINDNTIISTDRSDGYGINTAWADITMNGGKIETPGLSSYSVTAGGDIFRFKMNGGSIESGNVGLYLTNTDSAEKTVKINDGTIDAINYGIYQTGPYNTTMGNVESVVSKVTPFIEGGITSIYKTNGNLTFNNGKLKGALNAFEGAVDSVRDGYEIYYDNEEHTANALKIRTFSVTDVSNTPVSKMPKNGNGYARISYTPDNVTSLPDVTIVGEVTGNGNGTQGTNGISNNVVETKEYEYTGEEERYIVPTTGVYKLETWGAQGGRSRCDGNICGNPGYGGYSTGYIYLKSGDVLYINVGGQGAVGIMNSNAPGGYNGGGSGSSDGENYSGYEASGGGGGATHIATKSGLLSTLSDYTDKILIVSGAGGGSSYSYTGGSGGGTKGGTADSSTLSGTQTSGFAFGKGQDGSGVADSDGVAGGGAGFYGGYMNNQSYQSSGSGGSGYIGNSKLYNKHMYGYNVETSTNESDKTLSNGTSSCKSSDPTVDCAKAGDGYARITFVQSSIDFDYINNEQEYTVTKTGLYRVETWGAKGGGAQGGYGGYSTGYIYLNSGEKLYINVGGTTSSGTGGYNGGGTNTVNNHGGGGATHIATESGLLTTFESKQDKLIIVSGGGGGQADEHNVYAGGSGGGFKGGNGVGADPGYAGTQTGGGASSSRGCCSDRINGSFGKGGQCRWYSEPLGAGGGGYYGGGAGGGSSDNGGGGGGSGYIGNTRLFDKYMYGYNVETSNDTNTKTLSDGTSSCHASGPTSDCAKEGNGYARLTFVSNSYGFDSIDDEQEYVVSSSGLYKLETWGAQGGNAGGYGGYSEGYIYLNAGERLYINVGGAGLGDGTHTARAGGYNGGGSTRTDSDGNTRQASGGGATHIATSSGLLSTLEDDKDSILIVSGGGGGHGFNAAGDARLIAHAGGFKGNTTNEGNGNTAEGGTQEAGGTATGPICGGDHNDYCRPGTFGQGGNNVYAAGGGGYYGGAGVGQANGGGSGYIGNTKLFDKQMYCYNCETSDDYSTKTVSDGTDSCHSSTPTINCAKEGSGYARITLINSSYRFNYTNDEQEYNVSQTGTYKLETWGAQGGSYTDTYKGGYGGYSTGLAILNNGDKLYVNVGGQGAATTSQSAGGYNGGGIGTGGYCSENRYGGSGGGATHIATSTGVLSSLENDKGSILIVSGGGGGANYLPAAYGSGANGGGFVGNTSTWTNRSHNYYVQPTGGSQTEGGLRGYSYMETTRVSASFGQGGDFIGGDCSEGAGGGGGYYGGGSGQFAPGGGGSGYIGNSTLFDKHMTCYNCDTSTDEDTKTISNTCYSNDPTSDCAKEGNGSALITMVSSEQIGVNTVTYSSDKGTLSFLFRNYYGTSEIGEFPEITDYGDYYFDGWYLDTDYTKKVTERTIINGSITLYAKWIDNTTYCSRAATYDYDYNGGEQSFKVECDGTYTLEVWGASGGGNSTTAELGNRKGAGGYSTGQIELVRGETLYINVGGQGTLGGWPAGGYNGGGAGGNNESGSGGGATHIATSSGVLSSLSENRNSVLIVAGGGGGSDDTGNGGYNGSDDGSGGSAGGFEGNAAVVNGSVNNSYPGGTQTSGYAFGQGQSVSSCDSGGAGGGWFGGYVSNSCSGGGAGGSGYIGNSRLKNGAMYGYKVKTRYASDLANIAYLVPVSDKIANGETTYTSVQTAFSEAQNGDTLRLIADSDISYDVIIPNKSITFDLNGFTLTTSKTITNEGTLSIVNTDTGATHSKIISTNNNTLLTNNNNLSINNIDIEGYNTIDNTGTLSIQSVNINSSNQAIKNTNELAIDYAIITGSSYGLYNNSTKDITISNSTITASTAIYNNTNGKITSTLNSINGNINNNHSGGTLDIDRGSVVGNYTNRGTSTVSNVQLTNSTRSSGHVKNIDNYGNMTVSSSSFNNTTTYACSGCTDNIEGIRNFSSGNLISNYNTFTLTNNYSSRNGWLIGIENNGILRSSNDTYNMYNGYRSAVIYNSTNNQATVGNVTNTVTNTRQHITFDNHGGALTVTGGNIDIQNGYAGYGIGAYAGTTTTSNINYSMSNNTYSRVYYLEGGTITVDGGDSDIYGNTDAYLIEYSSGTANLNGGTYEFEAPTTYFTSMSNGTLNISGGNYSFTATGNANGIVMSGGNLNITGGNISMNGNNATGINASAGVITIGTLGGGVSTTTPYIEAIGTTSGTGITQGYADMYFYDGKVVGSTVGRTGILTGSEEGYDLKEFTDPNTGYKYCILDSTY